MSRNRTLTKTIGSTLALAVLFTTVPQIAEAQYMGKGAGIGALLGLAPATATCSTTSLQVPPSAPPAAALPTWPPEGSGRSSSAKPITGHTKNRAAKSNTTHTRPNASASSAAPPWRPPNGNVS